MLRYRDVPLFWVLFGVAPGFLVTFLGYIPGFLGIIFWLFQDFWVSFFGKTLERICDFQFMYIIWFLVVYLTYFMKPVKETTFSSKIHEAFFANIRNDCVFSVKKKISNTVTQSGFGHSAADSLFIYK